MQALRAAQPGRQHPTRPQARPQPAPRDRRPAAPPRPIIQPKLAVGSPGDIYEQEADRVAGAVMRSPAVPAAPCSCGGGCPRCTGPAPASSGPAVSRTAGPAPAASAPDRPGAADADLAAIVAEGTGAGGAPLDRGLRAFMEPRFGRDFGHVRVHADAAAARSARAIGALAYTAGRDIVFGAGRYAPHSPEGRELIAHELAHTIQQGEAGAPIGRSVAPPISGGAAGLLQRVGECEGKSVRNCGGSCVPPRGGSGFCRWSGTVKYGCICIPSDQPVLRGPGPEILFEAATAYMLYRIYQMASTAAPAAALVGGGTMALPAATSTATSTAASASGGGAAAGGGGTAAAGAAGGEATAATGIAGGGAGALAAGALPVIAMAGVFVALGAGYAEARNAVRNESTAAGFSQGFVMSLLGWEWHQAVDRFAVWSAQPTPWDEALGYIKANAYNGGLKAGFEAGARLPPDARKAYLREIRRLAGPRGTTRWSRLDQIDYVIALAAVARRQFLRPE
jgi:hypothetical protein